MDSVRPIATDRAKPRLTRGREDTRIRGLDVTQHASSVLPLDSHTTECYQHCLFHDDREPMRRFDRPAPLIDELERFQNEVRRLAFTAAHDICRQELERRLAAEAVRAQPRRRRSSAPEPAAVMPSGSAAALDVAAITGAQAAAPGHEQLALPLAAGAAPEAAAATAPGIAVADAPDRVQPAPVTTGRKRGAWTRETIIDELATWILSGTVVDAAFVTRHGPKGLVAATRRIFGRFEAAMNVAGIHVSKLYPDGPPSRP